MCVRPIITGILSNLLSSYDIAGVSAVSLLRDRDRSLCQQTLTGKGLELSLNSLVRFNYSFYTGRMITSQALNV